MSQETCELLLTDARSHQPVLRRGLPLEEDTLPPPPTRGLPERAFPSWEPDSDPESLRQQHWGVVVPEGDEGQTLLSFIEPLCRWREQCQGGPVRIFRFPRSLKAEPGGRRNPYVYWKQRVLEDDSIPVRERPRYLLFLGDADVLPLELQRAASANALVGRLAFQHGRDYEAYVDKVLRWERSRPTAARARALFYTARDGTSATRLGHEALMEPGFRAVGRARQWELAAGEREKWLMQLGEGRNGEALPGCAAEPTPSVLFSLSQGVGSPASGWRGTHEKMALQGAMSLGGGRNLDASRLAHEPFLPGGVWFHLASFGAATPAVSTYEAWLRALREKGRLGGELEPLRASLPATAESPFIAALPRAVLANPEGPLAFIGHTDLAWAHPLQEDGIHPSWASYLLEALQQLVAGRRVGLAMAWLLHGQARAHAALTSAPPGAAHKGRLWMMGRDLGNYILLGDPAVRLPLSGTQPPAVIHAGSVPSLSLRPPEPEPRTAPEPRTDTAARAMPGTKATSDTKSTPRNRARPRSSSNTQASSPHTPVKVQISSEEWVTALSLPGLEPPPK